MKPPASLVFSCLGFSTTAEASDLSGALGAHATRNTADQRVTLGCERDLSCFLGVRRELRLTESPSLSLDPV